MKPFSQASENNKDSILAVLREEFREAERVLEIGTGTGQHAVYFGARLTHIVWQTSDLNHNHAGISAWLEEARLENVMLPLTLDVNERVWPIESVDGVFSANTLHIMDWSSVVSMFDGMGRVLASGGVVAFYGPFNFNGAYTSESNQRFDQYLRSRDPLSGIRDFEALDELAARQGMTLLRDHEMPANNRILVWKRA